MQSDKSDESHRVSCGKCGGALAKIKPRQDVVAIYAMSVADTDLCFEPALHIFYGERVLDMADGLPKWDTVPAAWVGNGIELPEPTGTGWRSRYPQVDR